MQAEQPISGQQPTPPEAAAPPEAPSPMVQIYPTKDPKQVSQFWAEKYEKDAEKNWDLFYKNNQERFFKDRHYLFREFPELTPPEDATNHVVLEAGCGVGNTVYPVLESDKRIFVHCCDFSKRAVELVHKHADYDQDRVNAFQCDITSKSLSENVPADGVDVIMLVFVLSAISPEKMPATVENLAQVLRRHERSRVFIRDYAEGDLAEDRLESKRNRKISENFYVRGDGTRAFYFTKENMRELFENAGFETMEMKVHEKEVENRAQKIKMDRRWIQGHFRLRALP